MTPLPNARSQQLQLLQASINLPPRVHTPTPMFTRLPPIHNRTPHLDSWTLEFAHEASSLRRARVIGTPLGPQEPGLVIKYKILFFNHSSEALEDASRTVWKSRHELLPAGAHTHTQRWFGDLAGVLSRSDMLANEPSEVERQKQGNAEPYEAKCARSVFAEKFEGSDSQRRQKERSTANQAKKDGERRI